MTIDFTSVTEFPGRPITREQLVRLYLRYHTAGLYAKGKRILEVACGPGLGLGYLARKAKSIVGGDYTENLLQIAQAHYQGRIPLVRLDAHQLPFRDKVFDVVLLLEAIYYLKNPEWFIAESRRVLSDGGILLISTWNKDWPELLPGPLAVRHFSVPELYELLRHQSFSSIEIYGAFEARPRSIKEKIISLTRRMAKVFNLVPKSVEGREWLKRIFYGRPSLLKDEIEDNMAELVPLVPIPSNVPNTRFKMLFIVASVDESNSSP